MKLLIVYGTRYGMTKKTGELMYDRIIEKAPEIESTISDYHLNRELKRQMAAYDSFIVGSSIVAGFWKSGVKRFLKKYSLGEKVTSIFVTAGGSLQYAIKNNLSREEAIQKAITKYIQPVIEKYKINPLKLGVFGGQMIQHKKVKFTNWNENDILSWTDELISQLKLANIKTSQ